ncbi:MAG: hypothetical protein JXX29_03275 [Deltaproteobacteria bacterium]|nr:hypothetical protein [Deltaproteobacteria bacterium]MBN2670663.1 hypothetical protein [Deltaproteobacteria bacterium]
MKLTGATVTANDAGQQVLGFENSNDWSGISVTDSNHTEGRVSAQVSVSGWMQLTSSHLSTLVDSNEQISDKAAIDVWLPESVGWLDLRFIVDIPSQGIYWRELGTESQEALVVGEFTSVVFPVPDDIATALSGSYDDLRIVVIVNGPSMSAPLLLDNIRFAKEAVDTDGSLGEQVRFAFDLPQDVKLLETVVQVNESFKIATAAHPQNQTANVVTWARV